MTYYIFQPKVEVRWLEGFDLWSLLSSKSNFWNCPTWNHLIWEVFLISFCNNCHQILLDSSAFHKSSQHPNNILHPNIQSVMQVASKALLVLIQTSKSWNWKLNILCLTRYNLKDKTLSNCFLLFRMRSQRMPRWVEKK